MAVTGEIEAGVVLAERYRVRDRLGEGGMATVFLAEDCVLCRDVAVKRLHTEGSKLDRERFRREARLGASLIHPNLVTIFDTLSGPDGVLIVMEYVQGRPLSDLIGPDGMDPKRLLEVLRPVASALDYAHEHGVVHRDVKPANILIAEDRGVKLVDLGTAIAGHLAQITAEHEVVGTLSYIAPERLAAESVGEPAADVYSLAVVAFEALTGRGPYRSETPGELLDEIDAGPPPDVRDHWPEASSRLARVLMQGMDRDPERRQGSASFLVREIEAALPPAGARASRRPVEPTRPYTPPAADDGPPPISVLQSGYAPQRRPRWVVPALLAICALIGVGAWLALSGGGGENGGGGRNAKQAAASSKSPSASGGGAKAASAGAATTPAPPAAAPPTAAPVTSAPAATSGDGAQLNDEGYSLIQQGRYQEAVPVLRRAVAAFPPGTSDINYAYALYNLGHALRLAGQPQEAIPILERRLQIPDQTDTVQAELDAARAAAGQ